MLPPATEGNLNVLSSDRWLMIIGVNALCRLILVESPIRQWFFNLSRVLDEHGAQV